MLRAQQPNQLVLDDGQAPEQVRIHVQPEVLIPSSSGHGFRRMGRSDRLSIDTPFRQVALRRDGARGIRHVALNRKEGREQLAGRIIPTLQRPNEVWLNLYAVDGGKTRPGAEIRVHYVKVWDDGGTFSVATEDHAGNILITFFEADSWAALDRRRRGILVYSGMDK